MGNFNRGGRIGGDRSFGGRRDFGAPREDRPMFQTVCSKCGKDCEVPFRPTGDRPVFCRDCFRENSESNSGRSEGRNFSRPSFNRRENSITTPQYDSQFEALSKKLDRIIELLTPKTLEETISDPSEEITPVKKRSPKKSS